MKKGITLTPQARASQVVYVPAPFEVRSAEDICAAGHIKLGALPDDAQTVILNRAW